MYFYGKKYVLQECMPLSTPDIELQESGFCKVIDEFKF